MPAKAPTPTAIEVRATFAERPADLPRIVAYAFSRGGTLIDMQPLTEKGTAKLSIPGGKEAQAIRVLLGPAIEKDQANAGEVIRRGGIERHVALREGVEVPPVAFDVGPEILPAWIGRLCVVKGTLLKRVVSGGVTLHLPVCHAAVDIYEVDPWPIIIPTLPDFELDRLREIVDGPWPPVRWPFPPPPPPEFEFADVISDPVGPVGLNPQPLPPKSLNPGLIRCRIHTTHTSFVPRRLAETHRNSHGYWAF